MNLVKINGVFKSVSKRDGGVFTNDKDQVVSFDPSYVVKFDENVEGEIVERKLKFPLSNKTFYDKLGKLSPYTQICLMCDVQLFTGNAKVVPFDLVEGK